MLSSSNSYTLCVYGVGAAARKPSQRFGDVETRRTASTSSRSDENCQSYAEKRVKTPNIAQIESCTGNDVIRITLRTSRRYRTISLLTTMFDMLKLSPLLFSVMSY